MRAFCLLFPALLAAQDPAQSPLPVSGLTLDLRTALGADPLSQIRLLRPGCWDGLLLGATAQAPKPARRGWAGATVEVWDIALTESPRHEAFRLYLGDLRTSLSKAFANPPASHHEIELSDFMASDPSNPQKLDLTKVQSLQNRFNRMPPGGLPVQ